MMLREKAIRNKLLGVLGFVIVLQASVIGWSLMSSPVAASEEKERRDFQVVAVHVMGVAAIQALCDTGRGHLIYFSVLGGVKVESHNLVVVENGCPKGGKS